MQFRHIKTLIFILAIGVVSLGFTWFSGKKEGTEEKSSAPSTSSMPAAESGSRSSNASETMPASTRAPEVTTAAPAVNVPVNPPVTGQPTYDDVDILKLQEQISDLLETNRRIKAQHPTQLEQIKRISEQARIHRKMLQDIDQNRKNVNELSSADVNEILQQEKLRLIQEQTRQNKALVETLAEVEEKGDAN